MKKQSKRSTSEFKHQKFRMHGTVEFTKKNNILVCDAVGPFNLELMQAVLTIKTSIIEELAAKGKWGVIIIIRKSALASPDVFLNFKENLKHLVKLGVASTVAAMVIEKEVEGYPFVLKHYVETYHDAGLTLHVFDDYDKALQAVTELLQVA